MSTIVEVLIVDDDSDWRMRIRELIGNEFSMDEADSFKEAMLHIQERFYYCAVVDKSLVPHDANDEGGMRVLEALAKLGEGTKGLMLTAYGNVASTRVALKDWKATDYLEKEALTSADSTIVVRDQIAGMIADAKSDYARHYGSGIDQLIAGFTDPKSKSVWEDEVIMSIGQRGGQRALAEFLDQLLESVPPLIPYHPGEPMKIDRTSAAVAGEYWSKGLGESILVKFGRTAEIEATLQSLAPESVIRHVNHAPYSGFIVKAGLRFVDLPQRA
jgi:ActR/RegA family two-component response regulator